MIEIVAALFLEMDPPCDPNRFVKYQQTYEIDPSQTTIIFQDHQFCNGKKTYDMCVVKNKENIFYVMGSCSPIRKKHHRNSSI